jgi:hypothetical protein
MYFVDMLQKLWIYNYTHAVFYMWALSAVNKVLTKK